MTNNPLMRPNSIIPSHPSTATCFFVQTTSPAETADFKAVQTSKSSGFNKPSTCHHGNLRGDIDPPKAKPIPHGKIRPY